MGLTMGSRGKKGKSENQKIMDRIMGENKKTSDQPKKKDKKAVVRKGY